MARWGMEEAVYASGVAGLLGVAGILWALDLALVAAFPAGLAFLMALHYVLGDDLPWVVP